MQNIFFLEMNGFEFLAHIRTPFSLNVVQVAKILTLLFLFNPTLNEPGTVILKIIKNSTEISLILNRILSILNHKVILVVMHIKFNSQID